MFIQSLFINTKDSSGNIYKGHHEHGAHSGGRFFGVSSYSRKYGVLDGTPLQLNLQLPHFSNTFSIYLCLEYDPVKLATYLDDSYRISHFGAFMPRSFNPKLFHNNRSLLRFVLGAACICTEYQNNTLTTVCFKIYKTSKRPYLFSSITMFGPIQQQVSLKQFNTILY